MKGQTAPQIKRMIVFIKQYRYVVLMIVVGMVLLLLPSSSEEGVAPVEETVAVDEVEMLEQRLSQALSQIAGAGDTQVILTLEDSGQQILAQDTEQDDTATASQTVVVSDASRGEAVVPLQQISPTFRGALVVSQGADNPIVQLSLVNAVAVLTGLATNRIAVCTAK